MIKETTEIAFSALFLDIYLKFITDGPLSITLYDKRNDFSIDYLNLPHFDLILIPVYQPLKPNFPLEENNTLLKNILPFA